MVVAASGWRSTGGLAASLLIMDWRNSTVLGQAKTGHSSGPPSVYLVRHCRACQGLKRDFLFSSDSKTHRDQSIQGTSGAICVDLSCTTPCTPRRTGAKGAQQGRWGAHWLFSSWPLRSPALPCVWYPAIPILPTSRPGRSRSWASRLPCRPVSRSGPVHTRTH